jgi:single-strand DNA-binding protein
MIKLQFIGNLGHDAVRKEVNGKAVLNFRAAQTQKFKDQQGVLNERTTWVDCSFWEHENVAPFLTTGRQVYVEGIPSLETYVTKAGEPAISLKLRVSKLQLLSNPREESKQTDDDAGINAVADVADDLPF